MVTRGGGEAIPNAGEDAEQLQLSYIAGVGAKWYSHFANRCGRFLKKLNLHLPLLDVYPTENVHSHRNLERNVNHSIICHHKKLETTHIGILLGYKKEQTTNIHNTTDESQMHYAEWKRPSDLTI